MELENVQQTMQSATMRFAGYHFFNGDDDIGIYKVLTILKSMELRMTRYPYGSREPWMTQTTRHIGQPIAQFVLIAQRSLSRGTMGPRTIKNDGARALCSPLRQRANHQKLGRQAFL